MFEFLRFAVGSPRFYSGFLGLWPHVLSYYVGRIHAGELKQRFLNYYLANFDEQALERLGQDFCEQHLPTLIRADAIKRLKNHHEQCHTVFVVTASLGLWVKPWCDANGVELISTPYSINDQQSPRIQLGNNCKGAEKVSRIKAAVNIEHYEALYAYGDTRGDREMLCLADHAYFKVFTAN